MMLRALRARILTPRTLLSWQMLANLHQLKQLKSIGPLRHGKQTMVLLRCRGE